MKCKRRKNECRATNGNPLSVALNCIVTFEWKETQNSCSPLPFLIHIWTSWIASFFIFFFLRLHIWMCAAFNSIVHYGSSILKMMAKRIDAVWRFVCDCCATNNFLRPMNARTLDECHYQARQWSQVSMKTAESKIRSAATNQQTSNRTGHCSQSILLLDFSVMVLQLLVAF